MEVFPSTFSRSPWESHTHCPEPALHTPVAFQCSTISSLGTFQGKQSFIHDLAVLSQQPPFPASCSPGSAASPGTGHGAVTPSQFIPEEAGRHREESGWSTERWQNAWAEPVPSSCWGSSGEGARAVPREFSQLENWAEQSWWKLVPSPGRDMGVPGREGSPGGSLSPPVTLLVAAASQHRTGCSGLMAKGFPV